MNAEELELIQKIRENIFDLFSSDNSGHDYYHILRVEKMALRLAATENANLYVCSLAALLHEHDDVKLTHITGGKAAAEHLLQQSGADEDTCVHVLEIIGTLSYKGSSVATPMSSIEGKCVQDADRLDAMGATGIARTFCFCGAKGRMIHNPAIGPVEFKSAKEYHNSKSTGINHFYEKLLLLKDRMNTAEAKKIAFTRHIFMMEYIDRFMKEWDGIQ